MIFSRMRLGRLQIDVTQAADWLCAASRKTGDFLLLKTADNK